jgi:CheY-like chemotaxis protein
MYVEDNPANLFLIKRVARAGNHEVISHVDGEEVLKNFDADKPDLVLMDIQLTGPKDGLEVVKELRKRGYTIPIIAVTAYAMVGDRERCLEAGCDDYIAKPLPITELLNLLERYLPSHDAKTAPTRIDNLLANSNHKTGEST